MSRHRWLPVLVALLPTAGLAAPPAPDIAGQYRAAGTGMVVAIGSCAHGRMCGRIVGLGALPPTDANNPAPALQDRPLCGIAVLDDLEWQNGSWRGGITVTDQLQHQPSAILFADRVAAVATAP